MDLKACTRCRTGRMDYDRLDDCWTCINCGHHVYPEFVPIQGIVDTTGFDVGEIERRLIQMQEPIRQGMVHKRAIARLSIRERKLPDA